MPTDEPRAPDSPHLIFHEPDGEETVVPLGDRSVSLGRRASNDIQILEPTVSREHARIIAEGDDGWVIEDLDSAHGTFVNEVRVRRRPLRHNDRIRLAKAERHAVVFRTRQEFSDLMETAEEIEPTAENLRNLWALLEISKALNSSLRLDDVLDKVIEAVLALTRAERGMLLLGEDADDLKVRIARNFDTSKAEDMRYSTTVVRDVFSTGEPRILTDALQDARFSGQDSIVGMNLRTVMCVPLRTAHRVGSGSGGDAADDTESMAATADATRFLPAEAVRGRDDGEARIIGAVYVDRRSPTRFFTDRDLELFESFGSHAALAIENASLYEEALEKRRLERDIEVAQEIQQSLLRHEFPDLPWVEVHAINHPSRFVGGDYYEVQDGDGGRLGFAVGDVSGKGVPAALLMATLQSSYLAESTAHEDLARVCANINRFLLDKTTPERYATFFAGRVGADRELRYVSCGHNPQLLIRGDEIEHLTGGGFPLGLFGGKSYDVQERQLEAGDLLVCFTDGVTEATDREQREFGEQRLVEVIRAHSTEPVRRITEEIFTAIEEFSGDDLLNPHDDITLVLLRIR